MQVNPNVCTEKQTNWPATISLSLWIWWLSSVALPSWNQSSEILQRWGHYKSTPTQNTCIPRSTVFLVKLCIQITRTNQSAGSDLLFFCFQVLIGLIKLLHQCATLNLWLEPILRVKFHLKRKEPRNTGSHQWTRSRWLSSPSHPRQLRHPKPQLSCKESTQKKNNPFSSNVDETTDHLIQSLL